MSIAKRLDELGLTLPQAGGGAGYYGKHYGKMKPHHRVDRVLFLSGQTAGLATDGQVILPGRLGRGLTVEQGYKAARLTGLKLPSVHTRRPRRSRSCNGPCTLAELCRL
jgi:hypothetical protein